MEETQTLLLSIRGRGGDVYAGCTNQGKNGSMEGCRITFAQAQAEASWWRQFLRLTEFAG